MSGFTIEQAQQILKSDFAPWIQEMQISFDKLADGTAVLRIPVSERLNRQGGTVCGQAIMALADTAMVFAVSSAVGGYVPMTTVSQSTSFLRPAAEADLIAHANIIKKGRAVVYGEVYLYTETADKPIAHVTCTYMLL
mgnify:CR=1 FL=1